MITLADFVGTHVITECWECTRVEWGRRAHGLTGAWPAMPWLSGRLKTMPLIALRIDGALWRFDGTHDPGDFNSYCACPVTLGEEIGLPEDAWRGEIVVEIRFRDDGYILYATDETTGLCVLEVGTEFQDDPVNIDHYFWSRWKPDGHVPKWLEPDVHPDDKPVVIRHKNRETELKNAPGPKGQGIWRGRLAGKYSQGQRR